MYSKIKTVAHYTPDRVVNNKDIADWYTQAGTPEQIFTKCGIRERRYSELTSAQMATQVAVKLLEKSGYRPDEINGVIVGTLTPDYFFPSIAASVMQSTDIRGFGWDVQAACPSFLVALVQADAFIRTRQANRFLVIGVDKMSVTLNAFDYKTGILFGDAAAGVILELSDVPGICSSSQEVIPDNLDDVYYRTPFGIKDWVNEKFELDGRKVYRNGVTLTVDAIQRHLQKTHTELREYDFIIPHQANVRMLKQMAELLKYPFEKVLTNLEYFGNTASASVALVLSQKLEEEVVSSGARGLLVSFGAGYTLSVVEIVL